MDDELVRLFEGVKADLDKLEAQRSQIQDAIDAKKAKVASAVVTYLKDCNAESRADFTWYVYWKCADFIPVCAIEDGLGMKIQKIMSKNVIAPALVQVTCNCGAQHKVEVRTRSDLQTVIGSSLKRNCPSCEAQKEAERAASNAEANARYAAARARIEELRAMPYRAYLQSPEWQRKRESKLRYAHYRCQLCHKQGQLHVHHKTYENKGDERMDDLIVLCANCHAKFHDKLPKEPIAPDKEHIA